MSAERKRVLVLDDSKFVLERTRIALEAAGYSATCVIEPTDLTMESLDGVSLVLVDVNMREVFGDDVIDFMKQELRVTAPILLYSSIDEAELRERAQRAGADGYVVKRDDFMDQVRRVLAGVP